MNGKPELSVPKLQKHLRQRDRMLYFSYGSNMLHQRMIINNPSAELVGVGCLEGYEFEFTGYSTLWDGAVANIVPKRQSVVYGVVYTLENSQLQHLNRQEVGFNLITVDLILNHVGPITAGVYVQDLNKQIRTPETHVPRVPSALYKKCCVVGAIQHNLPSEYVLKLESFQDTGRLNAGPRQVIDLLNTF